MLKPKLKRTVRVWIALLKVAIGVLIGYLMLVVKNHHKRNQNILLRSPVTFIQTHYSGLLQSTGLTTVEVSEPPKIRILCYINTYPANYHKKAEHTHQTWARKCTGHLYTSTQQDPVLPVAVLNLSVAETRNHLWSKMRAVLRHIYQYADQYDFFLKADDDTYVVMENLLAMLRSYSPEDRFMLGHLFPSQTQGGYLSGGAGYVLSRATLKRLVEEAIDKNRYCPQFDEDKEDVKISICGQAVGVQIRTNFDEHGIDRFNWQSPEQILRIGFWNIPAWLPPKAAFDFKPVSILSDSAVSFHYMKPSRLYLMEYVLYHLRPSGIDDTVRTTD